MSKRLFVGNLSFKLTLDELKKAFADYGNVEEATIITNKFSGRSKGFGFVTLTDDSLAEKAIKELNGKDIDGRPIVVNEARPLTEKRDNKERSFNEEE